MLKNKKCNSFLGEQCNVNIELVHFKILFMIFTLYVIKNIIDFDTNIIEKNVENKKVLNR